MNKLVKCLISFIFIFLFSFVTVGYAALTEELKVEGIIILNEQQGVYIVSINEVDDDASSFSVINSYTKTILNNNITLGNDENSVVTYEITVKNNDTQVMGFNDIIHSLDYYDNQDIVYKTISLDVDQTYGISKKDIQLNVGDYRTFKVYVGYKDNVISSNNILNSVVNIQFLPWEDIFVEEEVPGQGTDEGYNHLDLLKAILDAPNGLNGGNNSIVNMAISQRKDDDGANEIGAYQHMTGGTLKKVLQTTANQNLNYIIHFVNDNEYHIYSFDQNEANNIGAIINVYKTKVILIDGVWTLSGGVEGTAEVVDYAKFYGGKVSGGVSTTINYSSFVANT